MSNWTFADAQPNRPTWPEYCGNSDPNLRNWVVISFPKTLPYVGEAAAERPVKLFEQTLVDEHNLARTMADATKINFDDIPGSLPQGKAPEAGDTLKCQVLAWLNELGRDHLTENAIWRDFLAFTDTFRTFHGSSNTLDVLRKLSISKDRSSFELLAEHEPRVVKVGESSWLDIDVTFKIQDDHLTGNCSAIVSLVLRPDLSDTPKIWMLRTWLENYEGHGHPDVPVPAKSRSTRRRDGAQEHVYDTIIVGGGQSGLGTAGRLNALDIDYVLFDNRPEVGDSWNQRYDSLKWHTIREYGNLPFGRTFSADDPIFPPRKLIGATYKAWADKHGINVQPGVIVHSADYRSAEGFVGKDGVVVGAANTAHDIAEDMADVNMNVTMLQRGPAFTIPGSLLARAFSQTYNLDKPTEAADRELATAPIKIQREIANSQLWGSFRANPESFDELEKAGFRVDRYGELFKVFYERLGGHFVDVGSGARIIKGDIKVKNTLDVPVECLTPDGLRFVDGTVTPADVVVLCTGFVMNHREDARRIIGDNADLMEDYWGLDGEGELKGWAKLAGHPHLMYFGGEVRMSRFFSRFVGLQIQRMVLGGKLRPFLEGKK
ncbi:hypothetical protein PRZ48_013859 [Zasmidium cellare]|uniref:Flavin-containing monooxygenase n=1 Tax=Zasmidium cellare TaxID=395010 RepID=A0ABR0E283_ZASCE|nr:hypothetical protein PRZ48_013859 [Zasmidium cellare]